MEIFVIIGECGEYSDRLEWVVRAVRSEQAAKDRVLLAEQQAQAAYGKAGRYYGKEQERAVAENAALPDCVDPNLRWDYDGPTRYRYEQTELEEEGA